MCGIAGVFCPERIEAEKAVLAVSRCQSQRGPDDEGLQSFGVPGGTLALGHHRLSILDLSAAGHQPMENPETGDWIVYNGEIYNYRELRRELESAGVSFRSCCDTEVILRGFARWGTNCFDRLHGMFAVAIYHQRQQQFQHALQTTRDSGLVEPTGVATVWEDFLEDIEGPTWSRAWLLGVLGAWMHRSGSGRTPVPTEFSFPEANAA